MAYFAPYIDASGLHIPTYTDIRDDLIARAQAIYGSDIYLENDSMDYQLISAFALKTSDTLQAVQLAYNNRSPATAVGAGLASLVKLNGLRPKAASYSTCPGIVLTGDPGAVIVNLIAGDVNGYNWTLPATVTLDESGSATVSGECQTLGAIAAAPGTITKVGTPQKGWTSVSNTAAAIPGQPVETDPKLKARQAISTELPSQTLLGGTVAGVTSVPGVTRLAPYENDTNITDVNGLVSHSIALVVEGGVDEDIAAQIYARKGMGGGTQGTTTVNVTDPIYGLITPIKFYRPTYVAIDIVAAVKAIKGPVPTAAIQSALITSTNTLKIGQKVSVLTRLWSAVLGVIPDMQNPIFEIVSLTAAKHGQAQGTADIPVAFVEAAQTIAANVTVNVV